MAATQSREFSLAGYAVLQIDLLGCGDSSDDFGDATWDGWLQDVAQGAQWLLNNVDAPLWLWGVRAGCLLASDVARNLAEPCNFLFWAATPSGKAVWQQFARLKAAGEMLSGNAKGVAEVLRQQLAEGLSVEVAGYRISPALAGGMERAVLDPPTSLVPDARLVWLDISTRVDPTLSPAAQRSIERWEQAGFQVHGRCVQGPSFWQTTEIEDAPALLRATMSSILNQPVVQAMAP